MKSIACFQAIRSRRSSVAYLVSVFPKTQKRSVLERTYPGLVKFLPRALYLVKDRAWPLNSSRRHLG